MRLVSLTIFSSLSLFLSAVACAKNKVVVIPLGSDVSIQQLNNLAAKVTELEAMVNSLRESVPVALGYVRSDGSEEERTSFGDWTSAWNASLDRYEITFDSISFRVFLNVTNVSLVGSTNTSCPAGTSIRYSSVSGKLLVYAIAPNGASVQCSFGFSVYP